MEPAKKSGTGPARADWFRDGDRYEVSGGHPIYCAPAGPDHAASTVCGALVVGTDPKVERAGVDPGFTPESKVLRAPDIAPLPVDAHGGWVEGVPPLAIEYADRGQDESKLEEKVADLLAGGTAHVWVVRLKPPRHVEVYEPGKAVRLANAGELLLAPGVLEAPIPVEALFEPEVARRHALDNLLRRAGYRDVAAIRAEGREEGREDARDEVRGALFAAIEARGWTIDHDSRARVTAADGVLLARWLLHLHTAESLRDLMG